MSDRGAETRIGDGVAIVGETDEGTAEPRHAQVVEVQRLPHHPGERKTDDERHHDDRRQQQTARPAVCPRHRRAPPRRRLVRRISFGDQPRPGEQVVHRVGGFVQCGCGLLLARQRAVQLHLQQLGKLRVDRRDRSRHRVLDDAPNLRGRRRRSPRPARPDRRAPIARDTRPRRGRARASARARSDIPRARRRRRADGNVR